LSQKFKWVMSPDHAPFKGGFVIRWLELATHKHRAGFASWGLVQGSEGQKSPKADDFCELELLKWILLKSLKHLRFILRCAEGVSRTSIFFIGLRKILQVTLVVAGRSRHPNHCSQLRPCWCLTHQI